MSLFRKDWAKLVPAAAVIPVVQMIIYIRFKKCEACLQIVLKHGIWYVDSVNTVNTLCKNSVNTVNTLLKYCKQCT